MKNESNFAADVLEGLNANRKTLPSKWIYNKRGDDLFLKVTKMPEYYLTRAEKEIFEDQCVEIITKLGLDKPTSPFDIIELGAGDGQKTITLLRKLMALEKRFDYIPIDISINALNLLETVVNDELPDICVRKQQGDYLNALLNLKQKTCDWKDRRRVVLFLGNSIGNMLQADAEDFLLQMVSVLSKGDKIILGVDLIKPPSIVLPAYSGPFNLNFKLNMLARINDELGGNFDLDQFSNDSSYTTEEGILYDYIKSKVHQKVYITALGRTFELDDGEKIQIDISHKYDDYKINKLTSLLNVKLICKLTDLREYFADYIYEHQ